MWLFYASFCFLVTVTLASIDDYDLDSFTEMCRNNVTDAMFHVKRINNLDLLGVGFKFKRSSRWGVYDYIIIGAGSAGTLLANRLSEDPNRTVLLLEAGGAENDFSDIPGMTTFLIKSDMDWGYKTIPQKLGCFGQGLRQCNALRGKVMGGTSTIGDKVYTRGNRADYDGWANAGNAGWSYREVLPYFIKTENTSCQGLDAGYHGTEGLLDVSYPDTTIFKDVYVNGMAELGYRELDFNGEEQVGVGLMRNTVNRDRALSGGRAFIDPIVHERANLEVVLGAFVTKVNIDENTKTATGVTFFKNKEKFTADASLEVILSAGAYNSPQILMLSGIGPANDLTSKGIHVVQDLPAVGQNYQDHTLYFGLIVRTNQTLFKQTFNEYSEAYFNHRLRPWSAPYGGQMIGFFPVKNRSSSLPDIQMELICPPGQHPEAELSPTFPLFYDPFTDLLMPLMLLRPKSRGSVTLKSRSPKDFPNIDYNLLSDPEDYDLETITDGIMETLKLLETAAFRAVGAKVRPVPSPPCELLHRRLSREFFRCSVKQLVMTSYHPCGTCRMGSSVADSVVSPDLRVHGMNNLRVVDASVFPEIPSGNINAPVFMVAEKAADIIKQQNRDRR